jgi:hypothetical protein
MQTSMDSTARRLDRLDQQVNQLRMLLLEIAVTVGVPRPELRDRALEVCIRVGLQIVPFCNLLRDVDRVIAEVVKSELPAGDGQAHIRKRSHHLVTPNMDGF